MATVYSRFGATNAPKPGIGWGASRKEVVDRYTLTTTQLASTSTIISMLWVPKNCWITSMLLLTESQLDSNGSPLLAWNVGDSGSANRFMSAVALGGTTGLTSSTTMAAAGIGFKTTADTAILLAVQAAAATAVAGVVRLHVHFTLDETA